MAFVGAALLGVLLAGLAMRAGGAPVQTGRPSPDSPSYEGLGPPPTVPASPGSPSPSIPSAGSASSTRDMWSTPEPRVEQPDLAERHAASAPDAQPAEAPRAPTEARQPETPPPGPAQVATRAAPESAPAPAPAALPVAEIVGTLRDGGPEKALARIAESDHPAASELRDALRRIAAWGLARREAFENLVGTEIDVFTLKGRRRGKVLSFRDGSLELEQVFVINGQPAGSTRHRVPLDELTPRSRAQLVPPPVLAAPVEWAAAALEALAEGELDRADEAVGRLEDHPLRAPLREEIALSRARAREAQARETLSRLEERAAKASTKEQATQLAVDLAAFAKDYADTALLSKPETAARLAQLKEEAERLALGLDPRIVKLFKGRVTDYDARTQVITLEYDFEAKEQTRDFIGLVWGAGRHKTGAQWERGALRTFCKGGADEVLPMPQFMSGTLTVRLDCRTDLAAFRAFEFDIGFFTQGSRGTTDRVIFQAKQHGNSLRTGHRFKKVLASSKGPLLLRRPAVLEASCQGRSIVVKENDRVVIEHRLPAPNDHTGFWIGGGWDSGVTIAHMKVSGRLDPRWLASALGPAVRTK
jgi:hypothetical protein